MKVLEQHKSQQGLNKRPMVSVALAAYNGERYIREQLDSVLPQLFDGDELVISVDPSVDGTQKILEEYAIKNSCIKILNGPGIGVNRNFEFVLRKCRGEIIFICDQDDIWRDKKISIMVHTLINTDADLAIHDGYHIDENNQVVSENFFRLYGYNKGFLKDLCKSRYSGCCMALKRDALKWVLPIPKSIDCYDRWIALVCELLGSIEFVENQLILHRLHVNNVTPKDKRKLFDIFINRLILLQNLFLRRCQLRNANSHTSR